MRYPRATSMAATSKWCADMEQEEGADEMTPYIRQLYIALFLKVRFFAMALLKRAQHCSRCSFGSRQSKTNKLTLAFWLNEIVLLVVGWASMNAQTATNNSHVPVITEICVANIDQAMDYSNNYGGWIELYNPTSDPLPLDGWYVSDDETDMRKHRLEGYGALAPGGYECVFFDHNASDGQYGADAGKQVKFKLDRNGGHLYLSPDGEKAAISMAYPVSIARCSYALTATTTAQKEDCASKMPSLSRFSHPAATTWTLRSISLPMCL